MEAQQTTTTAQPLMASEQLRIDRLTTEGKAADAYVTYVNYLFLQDGSKTPPNQPECGLYLELWAGCVSSKWGVDAVRLGSVLFD